MQKTSVGTGYPCPKCQGTMVHGFIPDFTYGATFQSSWHEGLPKKSFWRGLKLSFGSGMPIRAFRCAGCGFLELYAGVEFGAQ